MRKTGTFTTQRSNRTHMIHVQLPMGTSRSTGWRCSHGIPWQLGETRPQDPSPLALRTMSLEHVSTVEPRIVLFAKYESTNIFSSSYLEYGSLPERQLSSKPMVHVSLRRRAAKGKLTRCLQCNLTRSSSASSAVSRGLQVRPVLSHEVLIIELTSTFELH